MSFLFGIDKFKVANFCQYFYCDLFFRIERPPNINGSYGKSVKEVLKPGLIHVLRSIFLDKYIDHTKRGIPVKKAIWLFRKEEDIADVNDYLCEALPDFASDPSTCPWVLNFSAVGPATAKSIRDRRDEISLYLTTSVMLLGIDCQDIEIIGMIR